MRTPFKWNNANFAMNQNPFGPQQSKNPFTWNDVALVTEIVNIIDVGGGYEDAIHHLKKHPEKEKRFVKLLCKVEGKDYNETKEIKTKYITVEDVKMVLESVLNVNLKIKI